MGLKGLTRLFAGLLLVLLNHTLFVGTESAGVPAFLWSSDSLLEGIPKVSSFDTFRTQEFSNSVEKLRSQNADSVLVAFVQDALSLEDMSRAAGDDSTYKYVKRALEQASSQVMLPSVENPVKGLTSGIKVTRVAIGDVDSVETTLADLGGPGEVVMVDLPETADAEDRMSALQQADDIMKAAVEKLSHNGRRKVIVLYTGQAASLPTSVARSRSRRHLLANEAAAPNGTTTGVLEVRGSCLILYAAKVSVSLAGSDPKASRMAVTYNDTLKPMPDPVCFKGGANISFSFPDTDKVKGFSMAMSFSESADGYELASLTASANGKEGLVMRIDDFWWPSGFSFSCGASYFRQLNSTKPPQLRVALDTFQVEVTQNRTERFSESYDCASYFTTLIWMGLMVVLLYLFILAVGIFFLYDIRTNDRFDDPKGKTITVTTTD